LKGRLLVVDDERGIVIALKGLFTKEGYEVETAESGEEALEKVKAGLFHVIITDLSMKGMSGLDLLKKVREMDPACAVLMITAYGTQRIAVDAMKAGAEDYLPKPFDNDELRLKVRKVMETQLLKRAHSQLLEQVRLETGLFENMVGRSRSMLRVFETIDKAQGAMGELLNGNFGEKDVCSFANNPPGQHAAFPIGGDEDADPGAVHADSGAGKGAAIGLGAGAAVGDRCNVPGVGGCLACSATFVMPCKACQQPRQMVLIFASNFEFSSASISATLL